MPPIPKVPIRGTQSFVGIMGKVWDRPSLSALEIAWRWLLSAVMILPLAAAMLGGFGMDVHLNAKPTTQWLSSITVFQPVAAIDTVRTLYANTVIASWPWLRWKLLTLFLLWNLIAALGRTTVLRRFDPTLHPRRLTLFLLGTLRSALLLATWLLWLKLIILSARFSITTPAARNEDPNVVLFAAMVICGSLLLYVLWAAFSWFLQLAPLLATRHNLGALAALRAVLTAGPVRAKLIEINLVMCIVRIALIVLALVFSASPLPFTTVATPEFLHWWWFGVTLLYLAASDYFHVVRAASYLSLDRTYNSAPAA